MTTLLPTALALTLVCGAAIAGSPPSCDPPLPGPGQTVTWTLAGSPYAVCADAQIPKGGTVLVEPGVILQFDPGKTLRVNGSLIAHATPGAPFVIAGAATGRLSAKGIVDLEHTELSCVLEQAPGSTVELADCTFQTSSSFAIDMPIDDAMRLRMDRCTVHSSLLTVVGQSAMRDVTFTGSHVELRGYSLVEGLEADGASVTLYRDFQPMHVGALDAGGPAGPALELRYAVTDGGADFHLGADVNLSGSDYPVQLVGAGLVPGSHVTPTGNTFNAVLGPTNNHHYRGDFTWPDVGVPYEVLGTPSFSGFLDIQTGVTVRMGSTASMALYTEYFDNTRTLRGLPGQPIRFEPVDPSLGWYAIGAHGGTHLFEHLEIEGAGVGVSAGQSTVFLNESVLRMCNEGIAPSGLGHIRARGNRFLDNAAGAVTDPSIVSGTGLDLDGASRPNVFAGNGMAVDHITQNSSVVPAANNWWNHSSGPYNAGSNPGGLGDPVDNNVDFEPWLGAAPDLSDTPPVVRLDRPFFLAEPGSVVQLSWEASNDVGIAKQTLMLDAKGGGVPQFETIATLSGDARGYEWRVPDIGFNVMARPVLLRLEAQDTAGGTSFDQVSVHVPEDLPQGSFTFTSDLTGPFQPGARFPICWSAFGVTNGNLRSYLLLDNDGRIKRGPEGPAGDSCSFASVSMPFVSTDRARIAVVSDANGNRDEWYFSEPFAIRPDPVLGDAPPIIEMLSPGGGEVFAGGAVVPIVWTASDDESLRAIAVLASTDGARTWRMIARDLPGDATAFDWELPPSAGIPDVRVRVVAVDHRFQNSSDGDDVVFSVEDGGTLGDRYCSPAVANSTGAPAEISARGSDVASDNDLTLEATSLPANQFGYFLASETQGFVANPGGSQGNLCLGGDIARFVKQVQSSGPTGVFAITVDLTQIPTHPPEAVMAGDTWSFQAWYRDVNPDPTSNFTDGISILFE